MSGTKTALRALDQVLAELGERRTRGAVLDTDVGGWIGAVEDALREHLSFRIEIPITDVGRQFPESLVFGTLAGTWRLLVPHRVPDLRDQLDGASDQRAAREADDARHGRPSGQPPP